MVSRRMAPSTGPVAAHYPRRQVIMIPEGWSRMYNQVFPIVHVAVWTALATKCEIEKVPLSSTSEIIFSLNLESGTFEMQPLMSFYPLRLSPIIINVAHTASETDSGGGKKKIHSR